ncbi:MAG: hypothetical protein IJ844_00415, partial [Prevotella sp.]|nr:hypothetical protein [Prevotella sp.]
ERDKQHDADAFYSERRHLRDLAFQEHTEALRARKRAPHEQYIPAQSYQPFVYNHSRNVAFEAAKLRLSECKTKKRIFFFCRTEVASLSFAKQSYD